MERLVVVLEADPASDVAIRATRKPPYGASSDVNSADPLNRRTRARPDHNRVRDVPSPVSVLGLAPPPPR
jgi:hypothetical protein